MNTLALASKFCKTTAHRKTRCSTMCSPAPMPWSSGLIAGARCWKKTYCRVESAGGVFPRNAAVLSPAKELSRRKIKAWKLKMLRACGNGSIKDRLPCISERVNREIFS